MYRILAKNCALDIADVLELRCHLDAALRQRQAAAELVEVRKSRLIGHVVVANLRARDIGYVGFLCGVRPICHATDPNGQ